MPYQQNTLDRINSLVSLFNETIVEEDGRCAIELSGFRLELSEVVGGKSLGVIEQVWMDDEPEPTWVIQWRTAEEIRAEYTADQKAMSIPVNPGTLES